MTTFREQLCKVIFTDKCRYIEIRGKEATIRVLDKNTIVVEDNSYHDKHYDVDVKKYIHYYMSIDDVEIIN